MEGTTKNLRRTICENSRILWLRHREQDEENERGTSACTRFIACKEGNSSCVEDKYTERRARNERKTKARLPPQATKQSADDLVCTHARSTRTRPVAMPMPLFYNPQQLQSLVPTSLFLLWFLFLHATCSGCRRAWCRRRGRDGSEWDVW